MGIKIIITSQVSVKNLPKGGGAICLIGGTFPLSSSTVSRYITSSVI